MTRRERDILITLSAIGAAGLLVFFVGGPSDVAGPSRFSAEPAEEMVRFRRDADDDTDFQFCFGEDCEEDEGDDVDFFQDTCLPGSPGWPQCAERARKNKGGKKKGKGNKAPKENKDEDVDYYEFVIGDVARGQIDEINEKAIKTLLGFHRKTGHTQMGVLSDELVERNYEDDVSAGMEEIFEDRAPECKKSFSAKTTDDTSQVFFVFPEDMVLDSGSGIQASLHAAYIELAASMRGQVGDGKYWVGTYNKEGNPTLHDMPATENASHLRGALGSRFKATAALKKGVELWVKPAQPKVSNIVRNTLKAVTKNRKETFGVGLSCQMFIVVHTLPQDYREMAAGTFDASNAKKSCNIVPIFVAPDSMGELFTTMAANFHGAQNRDFTTMDRSLRSSHVIAARSFDTQMAGNMAMSFGTYMCACEQRLLCFAGRASFVQVAEEAALLTTAATTTGTSTTGTTTTDDGFNLRELTTPGESSQETTAAPEDKRCCSYSGSINAPKYDTNSQVCCNDDEGAYVATIYDGCDMF